MATGAALATAASRLSARLQENLSEAARDFGFNNGLDLLANGAAKHLEAGALSTDEAHKETKRLLESARDKEKEEGLRRVLALVSRNRPASIYFPLVTSCLSSSSFNVRSLVSVYILRQAQLEPDLALMSVNMFQKDLNDPNPAIRAMALRVLCGMALEPITGLVITSLKRSSRDTNWFVRKTVAACLVNLWHQDEAHLSSVLPILTTLLSDKSALVAGSAMATFNAVCPDHLDLLHPHYRHLCRALLDADEWGQTSLLATLTRYARRNLEKPSSSKQNLDTDLDLLLRCSEPLLQSKNPAVVMSVVRLFFDLAPASFHSKTLRPLLRLLHISSELQEVVLADLVVLTSLSPDLYSSSYSSFFVRSSDTATSKRFKLYCLINLINSLNAHAVLAEFKLYAQDPDPAFAGEAIKAIGMCALKRKEVAAESSKALLGFLHSRNDAVISQTVLVIRYLFESAPRDVTSHLDQATIVRQLVQFLVAELISDPDARASVYWMAGQLSSQNASLGPDLLRLAARGFTKESPAAKVEIVNLSAKLVLLAHLQSTANQSTLCQLFDYITTLSRYDMDYPLRDRARFLKGLLARAGVQTEVAGTSDANELDSFSRGDSVEAAVPVSGEPLLTAAQVQQMLFSSATRAKGDLIPQFNATQFGTLSLLTGRDMPNHQPLPEWTKNPTPASIREAEVAPSTPALPSPRGMAPSPSSLSGGSSFLTQGRATSPVVLTPGGGGFVGGSNTPRRSGFKDLNSFLADSEPVESSEESSSGEEETGSEEEVSEEESGSSGSEEARPQ